MPRPYSIALLPALYCNGFEVKEAMMSDLVIDVFSDYI